MTRNWPGREERREEGGGRRDPEAARETGTYQPRMKTRLSNSCKLAPTGSVSRRRRDEKREIVALRGIVVQLSRGDRGNDTRAWTTVEIDNRGRKKKVVVLDELCI